MKMKIAVPVNDSGILDGHFGHCSYFSIHSILNGEITSNEMIQPPPHEPGILPIWLSEQKVTHILASGMGSRAIELFRIENIAVHTGAPRMQANDLINAFLNNEIEFTNNGCDH